MGADEAPVNLELLASADDGEVGEMPVVQISGRGDKKPFNGGAVGSGGRHCALQGSAAVRSLSWARLACREVGWNGKKRRVKLSIATLAGKSKGKGTRLSSIMLSHL